MQEARGSYGQVLSSLPGLKTNMKRPRGQVASSVNQSEVRNYLRALRGIVWIDRDDLPKLDWYALQTAERRVLPSTLRTPHVLEADAFRDWVGRLQVPSAPAGLPSADAGPAATSAAAGSAPAGGSASSADASSAQPAPEAKMQALREQLARLRERIASMGTAASSSAAAGSASSRGSASVPAGARNSPWKQYRLDNPGAPRHSRKSEEAKLAARVRTLEAGNQAIHLHVG